METTINMDILRELVSARGCIYRQKQKVTFEQGMEALEAIGQIMIPGFVIDQHNRFAYENLVRWVINDPGAMCNTPEGDTAPANLSKGIYIQGNTGSGKSMALDMCRTLCNYFGLKVRTEAYGTPVSLAWNTYRADEICEAYARDGDLFTWKSTPCLCIQDFGSEPGETLYMGNRRRVIGSIIEARGDMYNLITLISTNLRINKVGEIYGQRVASRLVQMCNIITLTGPDRRK